MCNINNVVDNDLCCSCNACISVCPVNAINKTYSRGIYMPQIDNSLCIKCGECLTICPSYQVDIVSNYKVLDLQEITYKQAYIAYSLQEDIRQLSTSGGVVTTMVKQLLQNRNYWKAYLLEYENFNGQARLNSYATPDDIVKTVKSKYVPASVELVVKDIKQNEISHSIVVGTPCQLLAIKQALKMYGINEEDILFIGLFCDRILNYNIYKYFENQYGAFSAFHFRDKKTGGWPGHTLIKQKETEITIDRSIRMRLKPYFQLNRCRYCVDHLNQLSDISVGDCYINGFEHKMGLSNIIVRTLKGENALKICEQIIHLEKCSIHDIAQSQQIDNKRKNLLRNVNGKKSVYTNIPLNLCYGIQLNESQEKDEYSKLELGAILDRYTNNRIVDNHIEKMQHSNNMGKFKRICLFLKRFFFEKDTSYKVYIDKAGFINKGAALMLISIVEQVRVRIPDATIVVPMDVYNQDVSFCIEHGIWPLNENDGTIHRFLYNIMYNKLLLNKKYITSKQIDLILDAGGFQFSDQWKCTKDMVKNRDAYYASFSKKERKIIFLPQAYGPFELQESKEMITIAYQYADIMYARDNISYNYLKTIFPNSSKIKIAPDFTCLFRPKDSVKVQLPYKRYVIVIVNCRMITHTSQQTSDSYAEFICGIVQLMIDKGERVVLLNHEGSDDEQLLHDINNRLSQPIPILTNLSASDVKGMIKQAKLLISSRFHGVVSGLTQYVPTLCTSWSHKYEELLKEQGCEKNILSITSIDDSKRIILDALTNPSQYVSKDSCNEKIEESVKNMWHEIFILCGK